ncbi:hypothetical protein AB0N18_02710 [Streptomyces griseoincarnatus]
MSTTEQPTAEQHVDREPSATVTLRPSGDDEITLTAESYGMAPARVAYGLRMAADTFDVRARAAGDEPIPYGPAAKQHRAAAPDRPALSLLTEIYEELGHDHRAPHLAAALLDQHARALAEQVTALGKARGWSTWAADYIHPEREFVDTGEDAEEPAHVWVTALDDNDRPARDDAGNTWQHCGICGEKKTEQQRPASPSTALAAAGREALPGMLRGMLQASEAEARRLRARVAELERRAEQALADHTPHDDSHHCQHDGEPWPCPTVTTLDPAEEQPADVVPVHVLAAIEEDTAARRAHATALDAARAEPPVPAEGDRYVKRAEPDAGRIVTVNRVWTADDGHTAVAYQWRDDKPGQSGSACPLDVFHRTYEAQP